MLKSINLDKDLRIKLSQKINKSLLKERRSGKQLLTYISANTCIDILNDVFGHNWSMRIIDHWMEPGIPAPFVEKDGRKPTPQAPTAWCIVELEINLIDDEGNMHKIVKQGFGSQAITGGQSTQAQNGSKGAQSDAIKKAATLLGIALELYRDSSEAQAFNNILNNMIDTWGKPGMKEQYKDTWEAYTKVRDAYGWTDSDVAYYVEFITNGAISDINDMPIELTEQLLDAIELDNEEGDE